MADDASGSGASDCIPIQAGALKKGSHVVLKGFPCKIVEYSYVSFFCCALGLVFLLVPRCGWCWRVALGMALPLWLPSRVELLALHLAAVPPRE